MMLSLVTQLESGTSNDRKRVLSPRRVKAVIIMMIIAAAYSATEVLLCAGLGFSHPPYKAGLYNLYFIDRDVSSKGRAILFS